MISIMIPASWCEMIWDSTGAFITPCGLVSPYIEIADRFHGVFRLLPSQYEITSYDGSRIAIMSQEPHLEFTTEGDLALFKLSCPLEL